MNTIPNQECAPIIQPEQDPIEGFKQASLELLAAQLARITYPGYPMLSERYCTQTIDPDYVRIPFGSWDTSTHLGDMLLSPADKERLSYADYNHDSFGRPLHPWLEDMVTRPDIGVVTGKGFYWNWGPNYTADPIITRHDLAEPHVLLIERGDTGQLALPGGFVDAGEDSLVAAIREAKEESFVDLTALNPLVRPIYDGPLADIRVTAHAWPHTFAYHFALPENTPHLPEPNVPYRAGDDANTACWIPVSTVDAHVFGSHKLLIELATQ